MKTDRGIIDKLGNRILPITTPVTSKVDSIPLEGNPIINGKTVESLLLKELETDSTDNNKATFMGVSGRLDMYIQYKPKRTVKAFEFTTCDITKWDILLESIKERYNILKGEVQEDSYSNKLISENIGDYSYTLHFREDYIQFSIEYQNVCSFTMDDFGSFGF